MILSRLIITIIVTFILTTVHAQDLTEWFQAAKDGDQETIQTFITNGVNIEATDEDYYGMTALMVASEHNQTDIVELLIANGAAINGVNGAGWTALMMVSGTGYAGEGYTGTAELLIFNGADVNAADEYGMTALMTASLRGNTAIAELLLANGANINATITDGPYVGDTALMWASRNGSTKTVKLLMASGAEVNAVNGDGGTALDRAKQRLEYHTAELTEDPDNANYHLEKIDNIEKTIGILNANGAECKATC